MGEITYDTDKLEWRPADHYPTGAEVKVLRPGDHAKGRTMLLKLPPNWEMFEHSHTTVEQHFVLEGGYKSQGKLFGPGSYRLIPKETSHGPFTTESGATLLVIWDPIGE